jgi:uncharacterized membrane protein
MLDKDAHARREGLTQLVEHQYIQKTNVASAVILSKLYPTQSQWHELIYTLLFWLGIAASASSVIFFVAANWQYMGHLGKFALVEMFIVAATLGYWKFIDKEAIQKGFLLFAMLSVGALMALFGQTYQTGADPWQLFFNWAILTLPWVLVSRFAVMWVLWIALLYAAIVLYTSNVLLVDRAYLLLSTFFAAALSIWQFFSNRFVWLKQMWASNLLGFASAFYITLHLVDDIWEHALSALFFWLVWAGIAFYFYRYKHLNVVMLSGLSLSSIVAANVTFLRLFEKHLDDSLFLVLALLTIGLGTGLAIWLKGLIREAKV